MPVIPLSEGSQIEVPGNPVQIRNPESAGMMGEAIANAGQSVLKAGALLNDVAVRAQSEAAKAKSVTADAQYGMALTSIRAQAAAQPITNDDPDGTKSLAAFQNAGQKAMNDIANGLDPESRQQFVASASRELKMQNQEFYGTEVKKRLVDAKVKVGEASDALATVARSNPDDAQAQMQKAEILINTSSLVTGAEKDQTIRSAQQNIARATVNGYADQGQNGDPAGWEKARKYMTTPVAQGGAGELFDEKDKEQQLEGLQRRENNYYTQQNLAMDRKQKLDDRNAKEKEKDLVAQYGASLALAGADDTKRAPIIDAATKSFQAGDISEPKFKALINPTVFSAEQDAKYEFQIRQQMVAGKLDSQTAMDKLTKDAGVKLSWSASNKLGKDLQGSNEFEQRSGISVIRNIQNAATNFNAKDLVSPGATSFEAAQEQEKIQSAHDALAKSMMSDPTKDPATASAEVMKQFFGEKNAANLKPGSGPTDIDRMLADEAKKNVELLNQGLLSQQQQVEAQNRAHTLLIQRKLLLIEQQAAKNNSIAPARGQ